MSKKAQEDFREMENEQQEDFREMAQKWETLAKLNMNSLYLVNAQMDILIAREMIEAKQTA